MLIQVRNPAGKKGLRIARFARKQCGTKVGLKKKGVRVWTGFTWFRIECCDGLFSGR